MENVKKMDLAVFFLGGGGRHNPDDIRSSGLKYCGEQNGIKGLMLTPRGIIFSRVNNFDYHMVTEE